MHDLLKQVEEIFQFLVQSGILLLEFAGVCTILFTTVKSIWGCIKFLSLFSMRMYDNI
ncbi:MAG: hypothetical protein IJS42_03300 [Synergistaceae bacterium]|nr:hypothetical protein [Synergistaceae bacterium]